MLPLPAARGLLDPQYGARVFSKAFSLCQHEDLLVNRLELLYQKKFQAMADVVAADIRSVSPETEVVLRLVELPHPWDFEEVYLSLIHI